LAAAKEEGGMARPSKNPEEFRKQAAALLSTEEA
jgi:hypothetical protein